MTPKITFASSRVAAYEWAPLGRPIAELDDPFALEVHRAIEAVPGHTGLPLLPLYVERDHDRELAKRARKAAEGHSTMVVLVGGSSTGKTRACWEAIHGGCSQFGGCGIHSIRPVLKPRWTHFSGSGPRTVVWLNETQHYLLTGGDLGERVAARLRELLATPTGPGAGAGHDVARVLGHPHPYPTVGAPDPHAQARALRLTGTDIRVPDAFTGPALTALQAAVSDDPRLAQAQTHAPDGQITQFLLAFPLCLSATATPLPPLKH